METEEQTHNRLRAEISAQPNAGLDYIFKLCKAYHKERLLLDDIARKAYQEGYKKGKDDSFRDIGKQAQGIFLEFDEFIINNQQKQ